MLASADERAGYRQDFNFRRNWCLMSGQDAGVIPVFTMIYTSIIFWGLNPYLIWEAQVTVCWCERV